MNDHTTSPTVTPDPDRDGVILHLPEITYLDTQTWAVDVGLTTEGLAALQTLLGAAPAVPLPPADQTALREAVASCPGRELSPNPCRCPCYGCKHHCGAHNPEDVLPAPADQTTPLRDRIAAALYDHSHPGWAISFPDLDQEQRDTYLALADAVLAVLPAPVDRAALVRACASFVRDTYSGEWADDAAATLETDADRIERGEPCSLLRLAAVLPATTNHDTDTSAELASLAVNAGRALQDEKRHYEIACRENTRLRAMVDEYGDGAGALTRKLKRVRDLHRETCPLVKGEVPSGFKCGMCELLDAPAAPLRRMADETAATDTQTRRGDQFEAWLKQQRDSFGWQGANDRRLFDTLDGILDRYRLHADTGTPLGEHVCEGRVVGDCECLEQPAAGARQDGADRG